MNINGFSGVPGKDNPLSSASKDAAKTREASVQAKPAAPAPEKGKSAPGDSVVLSAQARSLQKLESQISDLPEVDTDRVADLKARIDSGEYQVNSRSVAGKLLSF
ncbi:flagellar biosynthesis anti-sigma factor FlgM [Allohahella marinimesophila]|uniref:Negative regulator of flagellin synthesis n=1 Tax=Allohahella marinimesophila TaxID=1054972 RepID=A0ABP7QCB1_9GAMM